MEYEPRQKPSFGDRAADVVARFGGSWGFIIFALAFLVGWVVINLYLLSKPFDAYPFILLNLTLSCLAALQAPIIMMSQNRAEQREYAKAHHDHVINKKAEREIEDMQRDLDEIKAMIRRLEKKVSGYKKPK
ncbi:MAG: DUF1003 domain-containing protein [Candidatus Diapherotrites archaeon]|nr:DUF1003 domain-containing protein [Candidatus Diapherotrites archaeon]